MEKRDRQLHVRVSAGELERARRLSDALGMSASDLVRVLIQLPATYAEPKGGEPSVVVLDRTAAARLHGEARRWGYHYNQAVHALNRIAYFLERDEADAADVMDELGRVSIEVDALMGEVGPLREGLEALADRRMAYL